MEKDSWFINQVFAFTKEEFESVEKFYLGQITESDYDYILRELEVEH